MASLKLFLLFLVAKDLKWFWMVSCLLSVLLMLEFHKALLLVPTLFLLFINDFPDIVLSKIAI